MQSASCSDPWWATTRRVIQGYAPLVAVQSLLETLPADGEVERPLRALVLGATDADVAAATAVCRNLGPVQLVEQPEERETRLRSRSDILTGAVDAIDGSDVDIVFVAATTAMDAEALAAVLLTANLPSGAETVVVGAGPTEVHDCLKEIIGDSNQLRWISDVAWGDPALNVSQAFDLIEELATADGRAALPRSVRARKIAGALAPLGEGAATMLHISPLAATHTMCDDGTVSQRCAWQTTSTVNISRVVSKLPFDVDPGTLAAYTANRLGSRHFTPSGTRQVMLEMALMGVVVADATPSEWDPPSLIAVGGRAALFDRAAQTLTVVLDAINTIHPYRLYLDSNETADRELANPLETMVDVGPVITLRSSKLDGEVVAIARTEAPRSDKAPSSPQLEAIRSENTRHEIRKGNVLRIDATPGTIMELVISLDTGVGCSFGHPEVWTCARQTTWPPIAVQPDSDDEPFTRVERFTVRAGKCGIVIDARRDFPPKAAAAARQARQVAWLSQVGAFSQDELAELSRS
jgi:hypothetical protein